VLSVPHVQKVLAELPACRLINCYGPTENTTFTTFYSIDDAASFNGSVPIGRPVSNTSVYILDRCLNPVPIGVQGELYAGGDGVARGYLERSELNAERFVPDLFSKAPHARLYRTGDLVRYRPSGEIEFIGRIDNQVKVRGYRIELGEIETVMKQVGGVREAVVVAREEEGGEKRLVGYVVGGWESEHEVAAELRGYLRERFRSFASTSSTHSASSENTIARGAHTRLARSSLQRPTERVTCTLSRRTRLSM